MLGFISLLFDVISESDKMHAWQYNSAVLHVDQAIGTKNHYPSHTILILS